MNLFIVNDPNINPNIKPNIDPNEPNKKIFYFPQIGPNFFEQKQQ